MGTMVVRNETALAYVGFISQEDAPAGHVLLSEEEWTFVRWRGLRRNASRRSTIDWRIVLRESGLTTADHLSPDQLRGLDDRRELAVGDLLYSVADIPTENERLDALLNFVDAPAIQSLRTVATLEGFIRSIDPDRMNIA